MSGKRRGDVIRKLQALRVDVATGKVATSRTPTVKEWAASWLSDPPRTLAPTTLGGYRIELEQRIVPLLGGVRLDALTTAHVQRLHQHYRAQGLAGATTRLGHGTLRVLLTDAVRAGVIHTNVADKHHIAAPRADTGEVQLPTPDELARLVDVASADDDMAARWLTTLLTGMRQAEALGLEPEDVDLDAGVIRIRHQLQRLPGAHGCDGQCGHKRAADCPSLKVDAPAGYIHRQVRGTLYLTDLKSRAARRAIPIVAPLSDVLARYKSADHGERCGLLWAAPGGGLLAPERDSSLWRKLRADVGLDESWTPHHARHAAASLMIAAGVPERVVMMVVGHASVEVARRYQHVREGSLVEAMGAIAQGWVN